jgi:hypothetical protein
MDRKFTFDDALAAAEALREISAGHEDTAQAVLNAAGLDGLDNADLESLCEQFGVEALARAGTAKTRPRVLCQGWASRARDGPMSRPGRAR